MTSDFEKLPLLALSGHSWLAEGHMNTSVCLYSIHVRTIFGTALPRYRNAGGIVNTELGLIMMFWGMFSVLR